MKKLTNGKALVKTMMAMPSLKLPTMAVDSMMMVLIPSASKLLG